MRSRFLEILQQDCLVPPGSSILVACSGGADSTALVALFSAVRDELGLDIRVAHFDHGLRVESRDDADAVANFAGSLQLPFYVQREDVAALASVKKENLEAAGRRLRREFLERIRIDSGCDFIALGHHRDDQVETVLFRLLRGCGTTGLSGMASCHPPYIRPLLSFSREQLRGWLGDNSLSWREDYSNNDVSKTRNMLRHQVVPLLGKVQSDAQQKLIEQATRSAVDEDYWKQQVVEWMKTYVDYADGELWLPLNPLVVLHPAFRYRIWLSALRQVNPETADELTSVHLTACDALLGGRSQSDINLPGLWVGRRYDQLLVRLSAPVLVDDWQVEVPAAGRYPLPDGSTVEVLLTDESQGESVFAVEFNAELVPFPLQLRNRRAGDRFRPDGAPGGRKLKDFLIDAKISREDRQRLSLLVAGEVLWISGVRRCDGLVAESGKKVLRIERFRGDKAYKPLEKTGLSC